MHRFSKTGSVNQLFHDSCVVSAISNHLSADFWRKSFLYWCALRPNCPVTHNELILLLSCDKRRIFMLEKSWSTIFVLFSF